MLVVTNALACAVLFGVDLSAEQIAGATSLINSTLIVLMLVVKKGSAGDPNVTAKQTSTTITTTEPPEANK